MGRESSDASALIDWPAAVGAAGIPIDPEMRAIHKLKDCARIAQPTLAVDRVAILIGEVAGLAVGDGAKLGINLSRDRLTVPGIGLL